MIVRPSIFMITALLGGISGCGNVAKKPKTVSPVGASANSGTSNVKGMSDLQNNGDVTVGGDISTTTSSGASSGGSSSTTTNSNSAATSTNSTSSTITTPVIACAGYVLDNICWYAAPTAVSCQTFCDAHGGVENHLITRTTCRALINNFVDNQRGWLPTIAQTGSADWGTLPSGPSCSVFATAKLTTLYTATTVSADYSNININNVCSCAH